MRILANRTRTKLIQQSVDDLTKGLDDMRITENESFLMQEIAEWCLVGGEDADYNYPITFKEAWDHEDRNEREKWREAIHKKITDMTKRQVQKRTKKIKFQLIKD